MAKKPARQLKIARKAKPTPVRAKSATKLSDAAPLRATDVSAMRDLFWSNIAREMLSGLSVLSQQQPELFDGRFAVLTKGGERIPIARVEPVFAVSIPMDEGQRSVSMQVQSTVFRVQTPAGEVFTLPLQEIRAMHALTPELIAKMQKALGEEGASTGSGTGAGNGGNSSQPFGLAAFTALPKPPSGPAPQHPTE